MFRNASADGQPVDRCLFWLCGQKHETSESGPGAAECQASSVTAELPLLAAGAEAAPHSTAAFTVSIFKSFALCAQEMCDIDSHDTRGGSRTGEYAVVPHQCMPGLDDTGCCYILMPKRPQVHNTSSSVPARTLLPASGDCDSNPRKHFCQGVPKKYVSLDRDATAWVGLKRGIPVLLRALHSMSLEGSGACLQQRQHACCIKWSSQQLVGRPGRRST